MATEHILVVDDEPDIRELVSEILEDEGFTVSVAEDAACAREKLATEETDLILLDIWMPEFDGISLLKEWKETGSLHCPVVMMSGHGTVETAVEATKLGAFGFIEKPLTTAKLLSTIEEALTSSRAVKRARAPMTPPDLVGTSSAVKLLKERYDNVAKTNSWIVLTGEGGSGRTLGAQYIHIGPTKKQQPFITITAGEFEQILGSQSKSAIAKSLKILIQNARSGTLYFQYLDELPETLHKLALQVLKSLRANQEQAPSGVRVICSINCSKQTGTSEKMRAVLHADCMMVEIGVPSLRDHNEDIPELLRYYVDQWCALEDFPYRKFSIAAQNRLLHYDWPGNVSELKLLVQTLLLNGGDEIELQEVEDLLDKHTQRDDSQGATMPDEFFELPLREAREAFEKEYLLRQLKISGGSVSKLAERVGMERTHLYRKLRSLGIGSKDAS